VLVVVLNPASGSRRGDLREHVGQLFRNRDIDVVIHEVSTPGEISTASRAAVDDGAKAVVGGGGDGTMNAVASVLAGTSTPLGVLPLGTLNHFAKDLQIPLDLTKAVDVIANHHIRSVDVGRLGSDIFLNNSSIGVYPDIIESRERLRQAGEAKWVAFAKATFDVLQRGAEVSIRLESDKTEILARTPFLFVGNNEYHVEGFNLGSRMRLDGGRLYAYFAPPVRTRDLPKLFAYALLGYARKEHALQSLSAAELWIDTLSRREIRVACDGELLTLNPPLHYCAWPRALNVIVPAA
jgi:diacylglycerol kinase family enzyme